MGGREKPAAFVCLQGCALRQTFLPPLSAPLLQLLLGGGQFRGNGRLEGRRQSCLPLGVRAGKQLQMAADSAGIAED